MTTNIASTTVNNIGELIAPLSDSLNSIDEHFPLMVNRILNELRDALSQENSVISSISKLPTHPTGYYYLLLLIPVIGWIAYSIIWGNNSYLQSGLRQAQTLTSAQLLDPYDADHHWKTNWDTVDHYYHFLLAEAYLKENRYAESINFFKEAAKEFPEFSTFKEFKILSELCENEVGYKSKKVDELASHIFSYREDISRFILSNPDKWTGYLIAATEANSKKSIQFLIDLGIPINSQYKPAKDITALHAAAACKNSDLVDFLIEKGANTQIKNQDNQDYKEFSVKWKNLCAVRQLNKGEFYTFEEERRQIKEITDFNMPLDDQGNTLLHLTMDNINAHWRQEILPIILIKGADPLSTNKLGLTPLDMGLAKLEQQRKYWKRQLSEEERGRLKIFRGKIDRRNDKILKVLLEITKNQNCPEIEQLWNSLDLKRIYSKRLDDDKIKKQIDLEQIDSLLNIVKSYYMHTISNTTSMIIDISKICFEYLSPRPECS